MRKVALVASGRVSGTYADRFHTIDTNDGTIGPLFDRTPTRAEAQVIRQDITKHRECLARELADLDAAEKALTSRRRARSK